MMVKRMFSSKSRMLMSRNEQKLYSTRLSHMTSNLASNYIAASATVVVVFLDDCYSFVYTTWKWVNQKHTQKK